MTESTPGWMPGAGETVARASTTSCRRSATGSAVHPCYGRAAGGVNALVPGQPESWLVSAGRPAEPGPPLKVPLVSASNFVIGSGRDNSRDGGNPTWEALEDIGEGSSRGRRWRSRPAWQPSRRCPISSRPAPSARSPTRLRGTSQARSGRRGGRSFATPPNQQPLELGATVSLQSATKFIGGRSDLLTGVATTREDALWRAIERTCELKRHDPGNARILPRRPRRASSRADGSVIRAHAGAGGGSRARPGADGA